jgi:hypothetical protein
MKNVNKSKNNEENLVLDTAGGEMPDPKHKLIEKASEAAQAFKTNTPSKAASKEESKRRHTT